MGQNSRASRRRFIKSIGVGATGLTASLAGCSGDGDGGGGGGGDGGGSGDSDGGTTTGGGGDLTEFTMTMPPLGTSVLVLDHITKETDILTDRMEQAGYSMNTELSWDSTTLFASGQAEFSPTIGSIGAVRMSQERDFKLTINGVRAPQFTGHYVRPDSEWHPDNLGGLQAMYDKLVDEQARFGIGGWGIGSVIANRLNMRQHFGYEFEEDGEFNVFTGDINAIPKLLAQEELAVADTAPAFGKCGELTKNGEIEPILWHQEMFAKAGLSRTAAGISQFVARQDWTEENEEAIRAFMAAWKLGVKEIASQTDELAADSATQEDLGYGGEELTKFVLDFVFHAKNTENQLPLLVQDVVLDQDRIKDDKKAIQTAEDLGVVQSGWKDRVEWREQDLSDYL